MYVQCVSAFMNVEEHRNNEVKKIVYMHVNSYASAFLGSFIQVQKSNKTFFSFFLCILNCSQLDIGTILFFPPVYRRTAQK